MNSQTDQAYLDAIGECKALFLRKAEDYGGSWRLFRLSSLTDQIFIKANRIRQLEEMPDRPAIPEGEVDEYKGVFNYAVMALMRLWYPEELPEVNLLTSDGFTHISLSVLHSVYDRVTSRLYGLMQKKNHDYGDIWRAMRVSSITDQLLVRVWRLKNLEDKGGQVRCSEGADANYADIANYATFALLKLAETTGRGPAT